MRSRGRFLVFYSDLTAKHSVALTRELRDVLTELTDQCSHWSSPEGRPCMGVGHCILPNSFALRLAQMAEHFFATDQPDTAWGMGPPAAVLAGDNGGEGNDASRQIVDCLAGVKNDFNDDYCVDDARPCAGLGGSV